MRQHYDIPGRPRGSLTEVFGGGAFIGACLAITLVALSHWLLGWPG